MTRFIVEGKGRDTNRKRKRVYKAKNESEAISLAEQDGTIIDSIIEMPPTEKQLAYANELGVSVPQDSTEESLGDLISFKSGSDKPATDRHKSFAKLYGVYFRDTIGKKSLFDLIFKELEDSKRYNELLSWFVFRVYRELVHGIKDAPIDSPDDDIIVEIAKLLAEDEKNIKSVLRYTGRNLIWFGQWTAPNGEIHEGGSNRTMAYQQASLLLKERAPIPEPEKKNKKPKNNKSGCLSTVVIAFVVPITIVIFAVWIRA